MSAFYLPVLLMLAGLILRGVAFEFRHHSARLRWLWDVSFAGGSLVATFMQGLMVGSLVEGLAIDHGRYVGGELGWIRAFPLLCGVGLCVGYALLGASWLVRKCEDDVRDYAYHAIPVLAAALLAFLFVVFAFALFEELPVMSRWLERPYLLALPAIGALAALALTASVLKRRDAALFPMVAIIFAAAFGTLAISFWPFMVPFSITIDQAAAPPASLGFMFWAGVFVFPLMLIYTAVSFVVFRGKLEPSAEHY